MITTSHMIDMIDVARPEALSEAAYWQERKAHWIKQGIDPIIAGELAWANLAGIQATPETLAEAERADRGNADEKTGPMELDALPGFAVKETTVEWHPDCGTPPWPLGTQWPPKTAYCPSCMRWWTGERAGHCSGCHHTFGSDTTFDQHRHGKETRRCRGADWMIGRSWWQDDKGIWRLPKPDHNPFQKEG